jgi:hypothetical protein
MVLLLSRLDNNHGKPELLKRTNSEGIEISLKALYRYLPDTPLRKPSGRTEGRLLMKEREMQVFERKILPCSQAVKGRNDMGKWLWIWLWKGGGLTRFRGYVICYQ